MAGTAHKGARVAVLATAAALVAIALGAAVCIAPVWQPGLALYAEPLPDPAAVQSVREPINVNTADAEELMALPGIGEAKAKAIIAWRAENGPFAALADLEQVPGISARMAESWQGLAIAGDTDKEA